MSTCSAPTRSRQRFPVTRGDRPSPRAVPRGIYDLDTSVGEQARPPGDRGGLGATSGAELREDVRDVHAHRLGADEQLPGDLAVAATLSDQAEDLGLPRGQVADRAGLPAA